MGVDSRAAAACHGLCARREELLVRPGQRPRPQALHARGRRRPAPHHTSCRGLGERGLLLAGDRRLHGRSGLRARIGADKSDLFWRHQMPLRAFAGLSVVFLPLISHANFRSPRACAPPPPARVRARKAPSSRGRRTPTHIASRIWANGANGAHELQPFAAVRIGGTERAKAHMNSPRRSGRLPISMCK